MKMLISLEELSTYKSRHPVPLRCENCNITFHKPKNDILTSLKGNSQFALRFCSLKCSYEKRTKENHIEIACENCNKLVIKQKSWLRKNKYNFCSRSCSATYQNTHSTLRNIRKSKAETYLSELIRRDFEHLEVRENVRDILPSGFELDLYLPLLNLAIELNGPLHFFPIHGQSKLDSTRDKDIKKQVEAQTIGCNLIVLDISHFKYLKETKTFLDYEYKERLKPILEMIGK